MSGPGVDITLTPPTSASEHSPPRSACVARCRATSEDEHAVSTVSAGPSSPRVYDSRPDTALAAIPVPTSPVASSSERTIRYA